MAKDFSPVNQGHNHHAIVIPWVVLQQQQREHISKKKKRKQMVTERKVFMKWESLSVFHLMPWLKKRWHQLWAIDDNWHSLHWEKQSCFSMQHFMNCSNSSIHTFICRSLNNIGWIGILCSQTSPAPIDMAREQCSPWMYFNIFNTMIKANVKWKKEGRSAEIPKACVGWFGLILLCFALLLVLTVSFMKECCNDFSFLLRNEQKIQ